MQAIIEGQTENKWEDYINACKTHPNLSFEMLENERKTQLCIHKLLHLDAWKHRMNGDKEAMLKSKNLAMTALQPSKTYDQIFKMLYTTF